MQQKAQLIAALLHKPDLLVVDEPFAGLDPVNTRLIKEIIEEQASSGCAVIMSTHQMYQAEALCARIALINRGRTVLYGNVRDIKRDFSGNALSIKGNGDFENVPGVLETRQSDGTWRLTLETAAEPQQVLRRLIERDVTIESFEVAEPSLDDIFVAVVQEGATPQTSVGAGRPAHEAPTPVNKLWLVARHEYLRTARRRSFLLGMIAMPAFIAAIVLAGVLVSGSLDLARFSRLCGWGICPFSPTEPRRGASAPTIHRRDCRAERSRTRRDQSVLRHSAGLLDHQRRRRHLPQGPAGRGTAGRLRRLYPRIDHRESARPVPYAAAGRLQRDPPHLRRQDRELVQLLREPDHPQPRGSAVHVHRAHHRRLSDAGGLRRT